ncbi:MAG: tetratricopeptide repeat protein [Aestuariivirgaceae bacterium]
MRRSTSVALLVSALIIVIPAVTLAAGGGGGNSAPKKKVKTCKKGYVLKRSFFSSKCIKKTKKNSGIVPDTELLEQGWALAYGGKYEAAIELFEDLTAPSASALNGLGYSHRKLGSLEDGIKYYKQALDLDPNYILARNYLGKGYLTAGKYTQARQQLNEIRLRCGTDCELYADLASAITNSGAQSDY